MRSKRATFHRQFGAHRIGVCGRVHGSAPLAEPRLAYGSLKQQGRLGVRLLDVKAHIEWSVCQRASDVRGRTQPGEVGIATARLDPQGIERRRRVRHPDVATPRIPRQFDVAHLRAVEIEMLDLEALESDAQGDPFETSGVLRRRCRVGGDAYGGRRDEFYARHAIEQQSPTHRFSHMGR